MRETIASLGAGFAAILVAIAAAGLMKFQADRREKTIKKAVSKGVALIVDGEQRLLSESLSCRKDPLDRAQRMKAALSAESVPYGEVLSPLVPELAKLSAKATASFKGRDKRRKSVESLIRFYFGLNAQEMRLYVQPQSGARRAAHLMALLTDLPPEWIHKVLGPGAEEAEPAENE